MNKIMLTRFFLVLTTKASIGELNLQDRKEKKLGVAITAHLIVGLEGSRQISPEWTWHQHFESLMEWQALFVAPPSSFTSSIAEFPYPCSSSSPEGHRVCYVSYLLENISLTTKVVLEMLNFRTEYWDSFPGKIR